MRATSLWGDSGVVPVSVVELLVAGSAARGSARINHVLVDAEWKACRVVTFRRDGGVGRGHWITTGQATEVDGRLSRSVSVAADLQEVSWRLDRVERSGSSWVVSCERPLCLVRPEAHV